MHAQSYSTRVRHVSKNRQHVPGRITTTVNPETSIPVATACHVDTRNTSQQNMIAQVVPVAAPASRTVTNTRSVRDLSSLESGIDSEKDSYLKSRGFPPGLRAEIMKTLYTYPTRIWILDNSGSMATNDGSIVASRGAGKTKIVSCSRWVELQETMSVQLNLALHLQAPCDLRLLNPIHNGAQLMTISSSNPQEFAAECNAAKSTLRAAYPQGLTPLSRHIHQVHDRILREADQLRADGQSVCVIIATDGVPSDNPYNVRGGPKKAFQRALNSLHGLPVWVVVRLLTDSEEVIEYWNDLDQEVELPLEVIDDWRGEAREVAQVNRWVNYSTQMHQAREMGLKHPLFDLLDEKPFSAGDVQQFMRFIFGEDALLNLPDPNIDLDGFLSGVARLNQTANSSFNIITKRKEPLININKLRAHLRAYSRTGGSGCVLL